MAKRLFALVATVAMFAAACSSAPSGSGGAAAPKIRFQLKWVAQTQFAGYYAAVDQGYYKDEGLDVSLVLGGPNIDEVQAVAAGNAEIGTTWLPSMLRSREGGTDLISIAQVFQRSGTRMAAFKDKGISAPADFKGKKVGSWLGGNEPELFAAMTKAGMDPTAENIIKQNFNMDGLLNGDLDVAQAMIYNEYAQILEAKNPATGALYKPEDLTIIDFNDPSVGTAMLQDEIFASAKWLGEGSNKDAATKFLKATFRGWIYCRDNAQKCVDIVLKNGSQLGASHQAWQMNEINALIWPSPGGIGVMDQTLYDQTVEIATTYQVLKAAPTGETFRTDLAQAALTALGSSVDTKGAGFQKGTVELKEGGN